MINKQLVDPKSIVIVGGSNDITKPGGKVLKNIIDGKYQGQTLCDQSERKRSAGYQKLSEYCRTP